MKREKAWKFTKEFDEGGILCGYWRLEPVHYLSINLAAAHTGKDRALVTEIARDLTPERPWARAAIQFGAPSGSPLRLIGNNVAILAPFKEHFPLLEAEIDCRMQSNSS